MRVVRERLCRNVNREVRGEGAGDGDDEGNKALEEEG